MSKVKFFKSYWRQFVAVSTATLVSISNGMEFGWSSPIIPALKSNDSYIPITQDDAFWLESLLTIAAACSLPISFGVLQLVGRKKSILLSGATSLIAWLLIATAQTVAQLYTARIVSGAGACLAFSALPLYIAEITEPKVRGFFGAFIYTMNLIGIFLIYAFAPFIPIYASGLVGIGVTSIQILTFMWQPESPYYLQAKLREKEAKYSLRKLRCSSRNIDEEMEQIAKAVARQKTERVRPIDIIKIPSNRKIFLILTVLQPAQNFLGFAVITMNLQEILQKYNAGVSTQTAAIMYSVMTLVSSILGTSLIDKFGRKVLLISSALLTSLCLATLGGYFAVEDFRSDTTAYQWIPVVAVIGYAFCFKYGAGLVPVVIPAEILPINMKSLGMPYSIFILALTATASIKIYYVTAETFGMYFPFLLFSVCGILFALFVCFYVPETKGKSLEEIQMILKGREMSKLEKEEAREIIVK